MSIALIGPHTGRRSVVAKAVSSSDDRIVREFAVYPDKNTDLPRLLDQNFDVVMIDLDSDQNIALQLVQEIASTGRANVIVYSSRNDPTLSMISMHAGATDFLPIPADPSEEADSFPSPERSAQARPVEVLPIERPDTSRILDSNSFKGETNGQARPRPFEAPRPVVPPASVPQQNFAPARTVAPPVVRTPEAPPRAASVPEPVTRVVPEARPVSSAPSPAQRQAPVPPSRPVPAAPTSPTASPAASANSSPVQRPVSTSALNPAQPPAASTFSAPVPDPVSGTPRPSSRKPGGIETDADVLELFRYGKGEAKDIKDPDALPPSNSKRWIVVSLGAVVIAALVALVVLRMAHLKAPATQHASEAPSEALTPDSSTTGATAAPTSSTQAPEKPSPAGQASTSVDGAESYAPRPRQVSSAMMDAQLAAKARISKDIKKTAPGVDAPPTGLAPISMESGGMQGASLGAFGKTSVVPVVSTISAGVAEGMAIHKTPPVYPKIARDTHASGTVVLGATINRSGMIENLRVFSGPVILRGAAMDAVKTWRYRPYMLNNQPVAVQTTINVVFSLGKE
jgi:protein TonB